MMSIIWAIIMVLLWLGIIPVLGVWRDKAWIWLLVVGFWLTTGAFFLLPWLEFSPWNYADSLAVEVLTEAVLVLFQWAQYLEWFPKVFSFFSRIFNFNGIAATIFLPNLSIKSWLIRAVIILIPLIGCMSIFFAWIGSRVGNFEVRKKLGFGMSIAASINLLLLVVNLNDIDAWGLAGNYPLSILPVLLGTRAGVGVWSAALGLFMLGLAGWLAQKEPGSETR